MEGHESSFSYDIKDSFIILILILYICRCAVTSAEIGLGWVVPEIKRFSGYALEGEGF